MMLKRKCISCKNILTTRHQIKFCSNKCQGDYKFKSFFSNWKSGITNGVIGITTKTVSAHLRRYLLSKNKNKCSLCGWNKRHTITGHVPLEIDHIDGNAENNKEENLRLLCPNCHSLTPFFRNLNKKKGRKWRIEKYRKNVASNADNISY